MVNRKGKEGSVLKDLDWKEKNKKIELYPFKDEFLQQLRRDLKVSFENSKKILIANGLVIGKIRNYGLFFVDWYP